MRAEPKVHEIFTHFKGKKYQILALAIHSETQERYIVYQAMYGDFQVYLRPYSSFMSEVDHQKYPKVKQLYRFAREDELDDLYQTDDEELEDVQEEKKMSKSELRKKEAEELGIDPLVWEFLDADTFETRLNILTALHHRITDEMINTMAVAIDVEINDGPIEERYEALKYCLLTREKYECTRL